MITKNRLTADFSALGIRAGMSLLVHSSLKSIGKVEGGALSVIEALLDVITPEGTLMMPSFNHGDFAEDGVLYDVHKTPTKNGIIPDTFWRLPGVFRSLAATHPFAAAGKNACRFLENHHTASVMGAGSPLDFLYKAGGYVLLLGVTYAANSFHHYVEEMLGAPCLALSKPYPVRGYRGEVIQVPTWRWRSCACPYTDTAFFVRGDTAYAGDMARMGLETRGRVGEASAVLYALQDAFPVIARYLREGCNGLPPCKYCTIRPGQNWF